MTVTILKPGLLTTVQDAGRTGTQKYGIIAGGCMDSFAARAANMLAGNTQDEAVLEMTVIGATVRFDSDQVIAVCGYGFRPRLENMELPMWQTVYVRSGTTLKVGAARDGSRCYLALGGGIDVPRSLGSRSTYLRARIGGLYGRALKQGDIVRTGSLLTDRQREWMQEWKHERTEEPYVPLAPRISSYMLPTYSADPVIRFIRGNDYERFDEKSRSLLESAAFRVTPQSDRMGYRLQGPVLKLSKPEEMVSEAVAFGTVQVPADGNPIVLMADRQTIGGYPKIAQVISVDLPLIAQLQPGAKVRFQEVSIDQAQRLYLDREDQFMQLAAGIQMTTGMRMTATMKR